eukprot:4664636-Pyramimonas_sp.AAC.1
MGGVEHLENHLNPDRITGMYSRQDKIKKNPAADATHRHHVIVSSCHRDRFKRRFRVQRARGPTVKKRKGERIVGRQQDDA